MTRYRWGNNGATLARVALVTRWNGDCFREKERETKLIKTALSEIKKKEPKKVYGKDQLSPSRRVCPFTWWKVHAFAPSEREYTLTWTRKVKYKLSFNANVLDDDLWTSLLDVHMWHSTRWFHVLEVCWCLLVCISWWEGRHECRQAGSQTKKEKHKVQDAKLIEVKDQRQSKRERERAEWVNTSETEKERRRRGRRRKKVTAVTMMDEV